VFLGAGLIVASGLLVVVGEWWLRRRESPAPATRALDAAAGE
jgi:hypothetical protein